MLSCKCVSLLLLAFVALAVAGTLQSTLSLKVPVLVAEGGARPARRFHFRPCQASVRKLSTAGDESTWKLPPLFMLGSNHYRERVGWLLRLSGGLPPVWQSSCGPYLHNCWQVWTQRASAGSRETGRANQPQDSPT